MMNSPKGRRLSATTVVRASTDLKQQKELYRKRYYDLWLTSIEVWIHQLLYVRKLYPSAAFRPSFSSSSSRSSPMKMTKYRHCQHPSTTNYIREVLTNVVMPTIFGPQPQQHRQQRSAVAKDASAGVGNDAGSRRNNDDEDTETGQDDDELVLELYEPAKSAASSSSGSSSSSSPEVVYEQYFLTISRKLQTTMTKRQITSSSSSASSSKSTASTTTTTATTTTAAARTDQMRMITTEYLDLLETKLRDLIVCGIGKLDTVEHHPSYATSNTMTFRILLRRQRRRSRSQHSSPTTKRCVDETDSTSSTELQDALSSGKWCYHTSTDCGNENSSSSKAYDTTTTTTAAAAIDDKSSSSQQDHHHHQAKQPQQLRKRLLFSSPTMGFHFFYRCLPSKDKDREQKKNEQEEEEEEERDRQPLPRKKKVRIALY